MALLQCQAELASLKREAETHAPRSRRFIVSLSVGLGPRVYSMTERKGNCKDEESIKYLFVKLAWKGLEG